MTCHLIDLGAAALRYLTELTHCQPRTWIPEAERLPELLQTHRGREAPRLVPAYPGKE